MESRYQYKNMAKPKSQTSRKIFKLINMKNVKLLSILILSLICQMFLNNFVYSQDIEKKADKYFKIFLNKNGNDLGEVFLQHQPQLNDCKSLFKDEYYKEMFQNFNTSFVELSEQMGIQNERFKNKTACRANAFNTNDVIAGNCSVCPGVMKRIEIGKKLKPNIVCYQLEFLETESSDFGTSYAFFTFLNGHWVYFPMN